MPHRPGDGFTFGYARYTETQSNRIFVTVECLYGYKVTIAAGLKRIVKPYSILLISENPMVC